MTLKRQDLGGVRFRIVPNQRMDNLLDAYRVAMGIREELRDTQKGPSVVCAYLDKNGSSDVPADICDLEL